MILGDLKGRDHLGESKVDQKIILKRILRLGYDYTSPHKRELFFVVIAVRISNLKY
jgi:hypothetical protein